MDELKILAGLLPGLEQNSTVALGPGDDCAVLLVPGGSVDLLAAADQLICDVHYTADTPPGTAGAKLMKRNLSDIAAMGGRPLWALMTVAANGRSPEWLLRFCNGAAECGKRYGVPIVGGDLASLPPRTEVGTLTILGEVPHGKAVLRSGAQPGEAVYVTGEIGNSFASNHHLDFTPRLAEGEFLRGRAGAMLDISDGLLLDAARIARASRVDLVIDAARVPLRAGAELPQALSDGEDYELLFTAPPGLEASWPSDLTPVARIGEVVPGSGTVRSADGKEYSNGKLGYEH